MEKQIKKWKRISTLEGWLNLSRLLEGQSCSWIRPPYPCRWRCLYRIVARRPGLWKRYLSYNLGTYHSCCGAKYEGEWKEDKQDGYGE